MIPITAKSCMFIVHCLLFIRINFKTFYNSLKRTQDRRVDMVNTKLPFPFPSIELLQIDTRISTL